MLYRVVFSVACKFAKFADAADLFVYVIKGSKLFSLALEIHDVIDITTSLSAIMKPGRHSKPSNKKGGPTQRNLRSQANVAGYEKRVARKAKSNPTTDLYEHVPEKTRRSKITLDFGRDDEGFEFRDGGDGNGDDEGEERERFKLKARLIGENEDDEKIASDDDEELDSDAAFEESDEERYEGFFSRKACIFIYLNIS